LVKIFTSDNKPVKVGKLKNYHLRWVFYIVGPKSTFICETENDLCRCLLQEFGIKKKPSFVPNSHLHSYLKTCVAAKEFGVMNWWDMHALAQPLGYRGAVKWKSSCESHRNLKIEDYHIDNHHLFLVVESVVIGPIKSMEDRFDALLTLKGSIDIFFQVVTRDSTCVSCCRRAGCKFLREYGMFRGRFLCGQVPLSRIKREQLAVGMMFCITRDVTKNLAASAIDWDREHGAEIKFDYSETNYHMENVSAVACSDHNHHLRLQ
jgi:hypothetical protein